MLSNFTIFQTSHKVDVEVLKLLCICRSKSFLQSNSAESVAMGLLRQFEGMQLPAASELDWLVPEQDAPQKVQHLCIFYYLAQTLTNPCSSLNSNFTKSFKTARTNPSAAQKGEQ